MKDFKKKIRERFNLCTMFFSTLSLPGAVIFSRLINRDMLFLGMLLLTGMAVIYIVNLRLLFRYGKALKSEEALKKLYIEEHDERRLLIKEKTESISIKIVLCGLILATFITGCFSTAISLTLLAVVVFIALTLHFTEKHYNKTI